MRGQGRARDDYRLDQYESGDREGRNRHGYVEERSEEEQDKYTRSLQREQRRGEREYRADSGSESRGSSVSPSHRSHQRHSPSVSCSPCSSPSPGRVTPATSSIPTITPPFCQPQFVIPAVFPSSSSLPFRQFQQPIPLSFNAFSFQTEQEQRRIIEQSRAALRAGEITINEEHKEKEGREEKEPEQQGGTVSRSPSPQVGTASPPPPIQLPPLLRKPASKPPARRASKRLRGQEYLRGVLTLKIKVSTNLRR